MDGCTRQDPAYRPAKGKPRLGGAFLCLLARVAQVHRVAVPAPAQGEVPAALGQVDDGRARSAGHAAGERRAHRLSAVDALRADPEVAAAELERRAGDPEDLVRAVLRRRSEQRVAPHDRADLALGT